MGAGASQEQINGYIRRGINSAMKSFGGERTEGRGQNRTASGVFKGKVWSLSYRVLRASNGETAVLPVVTINGVPSEVTCYTNLEKELAKD